MTTLGTICVIDDDRAVRASLESLFASVGQKCRSFESVADFMLGAHHETLGCLLLDVRMPGVSGLEFQSQLRQQGMDVPVIMMTGFGDIPMSVRAMKAGAVDFLTKPFRDQELLDAVFLALRRSSVSRTKQSEEAIVHRSYATLTSREKEVMALVTMGKLNKQIAGTLGLSEVTVKIHRSAVMRKMNARNLPNLVRMADTISKDSPDK